MQTVKLGDIRNQEFLNDYEFYDEIKCVWCKYSDSCYSEKTGGGEFPDPKYALGNVQLITLQDFTTKQFYTWGLKDYVPTKTIPETTKYMKCADEKSLLKMFLLHWEQFRPDVVTGWNSNGFDLPYIINRTIQLLGVELVKKLSPWGIVDFEVRTYKGKEEADFKIVGVACLDFMELYKKFTFGTHESYALGSIASEELGVTKLENPTSSFEEFYEVHGEGLFVDYNVRDTSLVSMLEEKLKLIQLATTMAYKARVNYEDVFSPVKTWDAILHNMLLAEGVVSPQRQKSGGAGFSIVGAYVKEPIPGLYKDIVSFDFTSLYPSIMMALNISPETYLGQMESDVDLCLSGFYRNENQDVAMAPNGALFSKKQHGIIPRVIKMYLKDRRAAKNAMLDVERQIEVVKAKLAKLK
jgi:DNA polymerase elongation subunit (family B)